MYLLLKLLHVVSAVMFLGGIMAALFWHARAAATRDARLIAYTVEGVIRFGRRVTSVGAAGLLLTGLTLAWLARIPIFGTGWVLASLVLFVIAGAMFGMRVDPLQRQMLAMAQAGTFDAEGYAALAWRWKTWGMAAFLTPVAALVLMVLRPF